MIQFHILQKSGPVVMFEGGTSKSANLKAVVELKFMPAAISQSTSAIEYSPLTDNLAPFNILMASALNLIV